MEKWFYTEIQASFTLSETDQEEGYASMSANKQPSPKHTTVEKWILDRQKRKVLADLNWAQKQQKTAQKITASSDRLKVCIID